jgi:hypothetical protein
MVMPSILYALLDLEISRISFQDLGSVNFVIFLVLCFVLEFMIISFVFLNFILFSN